MSFGDILIAFIVFCNLVSSALKLSLFTSTIKKSPRLNGEPSELLVLKWASTT